MDEAIQKADKDISRLLEAYSEWSDRFKIGKVHYITYDDFVEFVNARMETVSSCQILLKNDRVADTLGLCRSLLENYLLFILICRGTKYFRLLSMKGKSDADVKKKLREDKKNVGKGGLVAVEPHPKLKKHLMYIFEGLKSSDQPDYKIPYHYFSFQDYNPETMRLPDDGYFTYHSRSESLKSKLVEFQKGQVYLYTNYMSYTAMLECLRINGIVDEAAIRRIEAHYTYLGRFTHPTNRTFQELRQRSNYHSGKTMIGFEFPYEKTATMLAYTYVIHLAVGLIRELADAFDKSPKDYLKDSGSDEIRKLIDELENKYHLMWFIFNEPTEYDKFVYVIHHLNDEEIKAIGDDYHKVASTLVTFDKHIYRRFESSLGGWDNRRVGRYRPTKIEQLAKEDT